MKPSSQRTVKNNKKKLSVAQEAATRVSGEEFEITGRASVEAGYLSSERPTNYLAQEDDKLISDAQRDKKDYEKLYEKYTKKVYAYFWYRVGRDRDIAEDLTQETFLRAFRNLKLFEFRGYSYLSYLLRIAHNLLVNHYREGKALPMPEFEKMPASLIHDPKDIESRADSLTIWNAMKDLPVSEQNALILFYWDDLSVRNIAQIMDKSENAVKLLLSRGRKRLAHHPVLANIKEDMIPERLRVSKEDEEVPLVDGQTEEEEAE